MIFDKKMVRVLKLTTLYKTKRVKRNNQLLLCEAPDCNMRSDMILASDRVRISYGERKKNDIWETQIGTFAVIQKGREINFLPWDYFANGC